MIISEQQSWLQDSVC